MQLKISRQMNAILLFIIGIPAIEIYLMIKVGGIIGALNTILLIFFTAITGVYFARTAGINTIRSGFNQIIKNEVPIYEIISGAALAFAALLLILPGFVTDFIGFLLIIPITRKFFIQLFAAKFKKSGQSDHGNETNIIEGNVEKEEKENEKIK
jgi:UPF0716 protein FxsA